MSLAMTAIQRESVNPVDPQLSGGYVCTPDPWLRLGMTLRRIRRQATGYPPAAILLWPWRFRRSQNGYPVGLRSSTACNGAGANYDVSSLRVPVGASNEDESPAAN